MNSLTRLFAVALLAGMVTGIVTGVMQEFTVNPLIIAAEAYETGAASPGAPVPDIRPFDAGWARAATNIAVNMLFGLGGGLVLAGTMGLLGKTGLWAGLIAGFAAFVVFALAPSIGLPSRPPAYPEAELFDRQTWWLGASICAALGLGLIFMLRRYWAIAAGTLLLAAPHLWGAPAIDESLSILPANLVQQFALWSLANTGLFWILLGSLTGYFLASRAARQT